MSPQKRDFSFMAYHQHQPTSLSVVYISNEYLSVSQDVTDGKGTAITTYRMFNLLLHLVALHVPYSDIIIFA